MRCYTSPRVGPETSQPAAAQQQTWWQRKLVRQCNFSKLNVKYKSGESDSTSTQSSSSSIFPWGWGPSGLWWREEMWKRCQLSVQGVSFSIPTGEGRLGAWLLQPSNTSNTTNTNSNRSTTNKTNGRPTFNLSSSKGCVFVLYLHGISNHRSYSHRFKNWQSWIIFLSLQGLPLPCARLHGLLGDQWKTKTNIISFVKITIWLTILTPRIRDSYSYSYS